MKKPVKILLIIGKIVLSLALLWVGAFIWFALGIATAININQLSVTNPDADTIARAETTFGIDFPSDMVITQIDYVDKDWQSHHNDVFRIYSNYSDDRWSDLIGNDNAVIAGSDANWRYTFPDNTQECIELESDCVTDFYEYYRSLTDTPEKQAHDKRVKTIVGVAKWVSIIILVLLPWLPWGLIFKRKKGKKEAC